MKPLSTIVLPSAQIDLQKWDACVASSSHQNVFMYSFSLNALCENWSGIIWGDYEAVLPLPWRKKWGLKYMYQVPFMASLSVMQQLNFSIDIPALQQLLRKHFRFLHIDIQNIFFENWAVRKRVNFYLPLNSSYTEISSNYTNECTKNLRKAINRGCTLKRIYSTETVFTLYQNAYGSLQQQHINNNYTAAITFAKEAMQQNKASVWQVTQNNSNEPIFAAIVLHDKNRYYYWLGAPTENGRYCRATYFFIDEMIKMHCQTNTIFDFEGSDIENVAHFYQQFSPKSEYYFEVKKFLF